MRLEFQNQPFAPYYLAEALISLMALLIFMTPRLRAKNKQCCEKMALHICWADVVLEFTMIIQLVAGLIFCHSSPVEVSFGIYFLYQLLMICSYLAFPYSFFWAFVISHTAYQSVADKNFNLESSYPKYFKIALAFSCVTTALAVSLLTLSSMGADILGTSWVILFFTIIGMILRNYFKTIIDLKKKGIPFSILLRQLWIFPGVLLICFLPVVLIDLVSVIYIFSQKQPLNHRQKENLNLAQNIGNAFAFLIGFLDAFAYGYNLYETKHLSSSDIDRNIMLEATQIRKQSQEYSLDTSPP